MKSLKLEEKNKALEEVLLLEDDESPIDDFIKRIAANPSQIHISYFNLEDDDTEDKLPKAA